MMVDKLWIAQSTKGYQAATYQLIGGTEWVPKYKAEKLAAALEAFIPAPEVLKEMRAVYEANKHQCSPGILDHIDKAEAALREFRE